MGKRKKPAKIGHNSTLSAEQQKQVKLYAARLDTLENERDQTNEEFAALKTEIGEAGFDARALHRIIRERREDEDRKKKRIDFEEVCDLYRHALGFGTTPLGAAVAAKDEGAKASVQ